jgi:hypothetical protein
MAPAQQLDVRAALDSQDGGTVTEIVKPDRRELRARTQRGEPLRDTATRFDHRASGYSDRCVALAMAISEAVRYRRSPGPSALFDAMTGDPGPPGVAALVNRIF